MISGGDPQGRAPWVQPLGWMIVGLAGTAGAGWWVWRSVWNNGNPVLPLVLGLLCFTGAGWALVVFLKRLKADPPQFTVTPDEVRPGDEIKAVYRQRFRRSAHVTKAAIHLVFLEEATKGSGKSERHFTERTVVMSAEQGERTFEAGDELLLILNARIPPDAMHSFDMTDNELSWRVEAAVEIAGWPDESDYELIGVLPERPA